MQVNDDDKPYDDLNITPMLDLAYVLLVIFILLTTASVQGAKIDLPKANSSPSTTVSKTKVVSVRPDGQFSLNDSVVSFEQLKNVLRDAKAADPKVPVIIRGEIGVRYDSAYKIIALCSELGITSVGMAVQHAPGS